MNRVFQRLFFVVIWYSLSAWAHGELPPSVSNGQATIPLLEEREYLDRDGLIGESPSDESRLARDGPGEVINGPGLTPEQADHLSETFLTEISIWALVLFALIYRLLIR